ncbi:MAG TPA: Gfo/Idh/MocA family oxidoreductase [Vicinamibacterales bacterium]|nr:Gfo/Idh/MocA family oxidoreductase [Vicinamibacterales bacterium]
MSTKPGASQGLRVGLAGAGWAAHYHLESWARLAGRAHVVAIADPNVAAGRSRAAAFRVPAVYESVEAMLAAGGLDVIDVAAAREAHAPICRQAARHRLSILCQKPLAPTLAEAEALVADLGSIDTEGRGREAGSGAGMPLRGSVRLMVHENWRFRPHYRQIARWLREGRAGTVRTVTMSLLTSGLLPDARGALPALVRQPMLATLDRLLLMEVLIHLVDTLRFLLGPLSLAGARLGHSCPAVRGEDRASLFLTSAGGAAVSLVGDFMAHGHPAEQFDRLEILGTRGAITLEADRLRLRGDSEEDLTIDLQANYRASYAAAIAHFVDRLADGGPFETSPEDNLETLRIVEAAYAAGRREA